MFNTRKMFNYLIFVFLVLTLFASRVNAMTFYTNSTVCYNNVFEILGCPSGHLTFIKWNSNGEQAYCGNEFYSFHGGMSASFNYAYKKDKTWSTNKKCKYLVYNKSKKRYVTKTDGDCSTILGYVIRKAKDATSSSAQEKFITTQGAVWTYLGAFAPTQYGEANRSNWRSNSKIKKAMYKAFKAYATNKPAQASDEYDEVDENNMISISNRQPTLYYIPKENVCGQGDYKSDEITITNNCSKCKTAKITITSYTDAVKLYKVSDGSSGGSITFELGKGASAKFYLKSNTIPKTQNHFAISASYEVEKEKKIKISVPDTVRYLDDTDKRNDKYQSMFIEKVVQTRTNMNVTTEYNYDKRFDISFIDVGHRACTSGGSYSVNTGENDNNQLGKVCMNNASGVSSSLATFNACTCKVRYINSRPIGIVVKEKVNFLYGTFAPKFVYPGGGFAFSDSTANGNPTYYSTSVSWEFADYYQGKPYYYNFYDGKGHVGDASSFASGVFSDLERELKQDLTLNIATKDSNNSKASDTNLNPNLEVKFAIDTLSYDSSKKQFNGVVNAIKMNEAILKSDGSVSYRRSDSSEPLSSDVTSGGNKYYVPINYMSEFAGNEGQFPFNITESNLSLLGFKFKYSASCYEKVLKYDLKSNLKYRPISESTPFPKSIPVNWVDWYNGNRSNQDRLANSFRADKLLYSINLNADDVSKIQKYNKSYTNWDYVSSSGVDELVKEEFSKKASSSSYCPIGKFDASCDK